MNTNRTRHQRRAPAANERYNKYYAIRIRKISGQEWCVFVSKGYDEAVRKAENRQGCLEVIAVHELTRQDYLVAVERLKKGVVK